MNTVLKSLLYMVLISSPLMMRAGEHPVPLDKNVDAAKCLECHEDKAKGPHVHSAIQMGCTSCHEVRNVKDVTRIKLTATSSGKLCLSCHADKNAADLKGKVHPPAVRDCVKCHEPHQSKNDKQLLKPVSGDKQENLCLSCHTTGLNVNAKGSKHAALEMGCDTCHAVHKTGDPTKIEFANHLKKSTPQLCLDCHDGKDAALQKTHNNQPFATANCVQCHNPHQSDRPKLMQAVVHSPFDGGSASCSTCHEPMKDGKITLTAASPRELCLTCHTDKAEQIEKAKVQHPGAMGDCTDCHNPHAAKTAGLPKPDAVNVCLSCHTDQAGLRSKKHLHQPAFEQGCATCHQPHGSENEHLLRAKSENDLCLECHGPDAQPKRLEAEHAMTIFNGSVKLPEDYFRKVTVLPIKYGRGHPVERHPVKDLMEAGDGSKGRTQLGCGTCHQPHASAQPNLLVKDQSANMQFCASCHQDLGK